MEVSLGYSFDQDGLIRLQKDLNHLLNNLNDQNVKSIRTEYCKVASKGGETIIDGSLLEMYNYDTLTSAASTTLRLRAGYNKATSNFEFSLWNEVSTNPTISLDSIGNAVFSGSVNTSESLYIGNNIFLGQTGSTVDKGLYFNATNPTTSEAEGTSDMKTAIYMKVDSTGSVAMNINSTGSIDVMSYQSIYLQRSSTDDMQISSANFNINYYPHLILGNHGLYNAWIGTDRYYTTDSVLEWYSSNPLVSKGYIDASAGMSMELYAKSMWAEQGKMIEEFDSTVGWTPNTLGRVETIASSQNKRCLGETGLTIYNQTTASGDLTVAKFYTPMDIIETNGGRSMTTDSSFYLLFYIYDLSRINLLSTKAMQLEIASSTGLGDKDRYLIGGTTLATTLTTGWNLVSRRLSYDNYYVGAFNPNDFKYARISFAVNANSSGKLATMQAFGIVQPDYPGSTTLNMFPRYDDLYGGYRIAMASQASLATWGMHKTSSTGVALFNIYGLLDIVDYKGLIPAYSWNYQRQRLYRRNFNADMKLEYTVKCKNDEGRLPYVGARISASFYIAPTTGQYGVWASSGMVYLDCNVGTTNLRDSAGFTIAYNDIFKITIWKEDPEIYNSTVRKSQITALIEKVGTTQASSLAYSMDSVIWKQIALTPVISSCEYGVGAEIIDFKYNRIK